MPLDGPQTGLVHLRQVVTPTLAMLPDAYLVEQIDSSFGEGFAESLDQDLEFSLGSIGRSLSSAARDVGRFAQQAAPVVGNIGGGIVQGAMAGSSAGLPGIIAGGLVGGAGAGLSKYGSGAARSVGNVLSGVTQTVGQFTPMGRAGAAIGSTVQGLGNIAGSAGNPQQMAGHLAGTLGNLAGSFGGGAGRGLGGLTGMVGGGRGGAMQQLGGLLSSPQLAGLAGSLFGGTGPAGQMSSFLQRPETQQALAAQRLGGFGRSSIPVGPQQTPVPTSVFAQLLGHLAQQMPAGRQDGEGMSDAESLLFMQAGDGEFFGDPVDPAARAARLWDMLTDSQAERLLDVIEYEGAADGETYVESDSDANADWYDTLDLADVGMIDSTLEMEARYAW